MIETNNLYFAAFLVTEGLDICNVKRRIDGKLGETVFFVLSGKDEKELARSFEDATAQTNIRGYLENLEKVRDIMYGFLNGKNKNQKNRGNGNEKRRGINRNPVRH